MPEPEVIDLGGGTDRHHGQKNVVVYAVSGGGGNVKIQAPNAESADDGTYRLNIEERVNQPLIDGVAEGLFTQEFVAIAETGDFKPATEKLTAEELTRLQLPEGTEIPIEPPGGALLAQGGKLVLAGSDKGPLVPLDSTATRRQRACRRPDCRTGQGVRRRVAGTW